MVKKDLKAIVQIIINNIDNRDCYCGATEVAKDLAEYLTENNPYFNKHKFLNDCGIDSIEEIRE